MLHEQPNAVHFESSWSTSLRIYALPAVLSVVAIVHIMQWERWDRSSWGAGCGFGMFCTVDYHESRFVKCYALIDGTRQPIVLGDHHREQTFGIRVMPTDANLAAFGRRLATRIEFDKFQQQLRVRDDAGEEDIDAPRLTSGHVTPDRLVVEVWGLEMHGPEHYLQSKLIHRCECLVSGDVANRLLHHAAQDRHQSVVSLRNR